MGSLFVCHHQFNHFLLKLGIIHFVGSWGKQYTHTTVFFPAVTASRRWECAVKILHGITARCSFLVMKMSLALGFLEERRGTGGRGAGGRDRFCFLCPGPAAAVVLGAWWGSRCRTAPAKSRTNEGCKHVYRCFIRYRWVRFRSWLIDRADNGALPPIGQTDSRLLVGPTIRLPGIGRSDVAAPAHWSNEWCSSRSLVWTDGAASAHWLD